MDIVDIVFFLKVGNGTIIKKEHHNQHLVVVFDESALKALGSYPLYLNYGEIFFVAFKIKEKNYSNLENQRIFLYIKYLLLIQKMK